MDKNQYIVAFEIGSSKIVGAVAEKSPAGMVSVSHLVEERLSNCVRYGCVQNVENVKAAINRILKNIEDQVGGNIKYVYVGVSGRSLHSEVSEVNRGLDAAKPISAEIISGIIRDASRNPIKNYETIAVVPRTYVVDKNVTADPVGVVGSSIKIKANLIVAKPAIKQNLMRVFSFGIDVKDYIVTPLAVGENVLTDSERLGCMLVDLGAETTTVSIYKDGSLAYLATLPLGGRNITRDISRSRSNTESSRPRSSVAATEFFVSASTAPSLSMICTGAVSGCSIHVRSIRRPIEVFVRSRTPSSEPRFSCERSVSVSSRFRRAAASSPRTPSLPCSVISVKRPTSARCVSAIY